MMTVDKRRPYAKPTITDHGHALDALTVAWARARRWKRLAKELRRRLMATTPPAAHGPPGVHILHHGFALCGGVRGVPRDWPTGHTWVDVNFLSAATCPQCIGKALRLEL